MTSKDQFSLKGAPGATLQWYEAANSGRELSVALVLKFCLLRLPRHVNGSWTLTFRDEHEAPH